MTAAKAAKREQLQALIERGIQDGIFPGAAAFVLREGEPALRICAGRRMVIPEPRPMRLDTVFDLASLTKPIACASAALMLAEEERIDLDAPVCETLPEFERADVTPRNLLTHTSRLPAWKPLYIDPGERGRVLQRLGRMEPSAADGRIVYSCLGYIVLERLIARAGERSLDREASARIFQPLNMKRTRFNPPKEWASACAATEGAAEAQKRKANYAPRADVICGDVHDENAHFLGGVSGNAGLFSTLSDMETYARCLLNEGKPVYSQNVYRQLTEPAADDGETTRSLAWIVLEDGRRTHTGFTGTALQWHPERKAAAALLTNRIHPDATKTGIIPFRREFFAAAFA